MSVTWNYKGKLALVTGSTKGIGRAILEIYLEAGANVIVHSRKQKEIDECVAELKKKYAAKSGTDETEQKSEKEKSHSNIYGFAADLTKPADVSQIVAFIEKIGHLDILINNAGAFYVKEFFELTDEDWFNLFDANVMSGVRLTRHFLKKMLEKDETTKKCKGGNVIFVSSEAGLRGLPQFVHYTSTKAAQLNITRALAELTRGVENVRVNALLPGPTWTPGVEDSDYFTFVFFFPPLADMKGMAKRENISVEDAVSNYFKHYEPNSLKQKFLTAEEVAQACAFLTSDAATSINGSSQKAEGGIVYHI
ncbi:YvrD [Reticulomyxa filosa]|uniref:3-oxoacyl-[acyl-carrier-protein] reductase n=1 Tax=Reticulomyxa filosa TaxID=46433 RepID=X6NSR6_RETFI|nr:YvrD [Reticulomyxa filosa]|eukprot:ETO29041.1 YvrD [Reticulomyxa filosa]